MNREKAWTMYQQSEDYNNYDYPLDSWDGGESLTYNQQEDLSAYIFGVAKKAEEAGFKACFDLFVR